MSVGFPIPPDTRIGLAEWQEVAGDLRTLRYVEPIVVRRDPKKRHARTPLVVLLHGTGADEHDLIDLADAFPPQVACASIRGPVVLAEGGYAWFERRGIARPAPGRLRERTTQVAGWIAALAGDGRPVYLLGFSAGMMMAAALALDAPERYAGAMLLSGAIAFDAGIATPRGGLASLPVFHAHGSHDDVIPAELVAHTRRYLRDESGARYDARTYPIAHEISSREASEIGAWLGERA